MAIPTPVLLLLVSGALTALQLSFFPDTLPDLPVRRRFFVFLGISAFLGAVWQVSIYPRFFSPFRHLPGPKNPWPLIGHGLAALERPAGQSFLRYMNTIPNDGIISITGFLNQNWLLLTEPSTLSEVLVHKAYDFEKPSSIRSFLRIILGDGLIVVEGDEHKFLRKHTTPAFSFRHIKDLYPLFWSKAAEMKRTIAAELPRSDVQEINQWANKATLDIIGVAAFGRDFHSLTTANNELAANYEEILEPTANKAAFLTAHLFIPRWFLATLPWGLNQVLERTTRVLRRCCRELVQDKREQMKTQSANHVDILSILIKSGDFGDNMIAQQLLTFLAAGHETTSSAFTWATYLLSKHADVQIRLREEIRTAIPSLSAASSDPSLDLATILESLPLLNAVCLETLRLYPTVPVSMRVANKDTSIGALAVPKGTRIYLVPWAINRCEKFWGPDPLAFRPDRWIDMDTGHANKTGGAASNYNILTFLHGPRSCIGEKFAKAELKSLVAVFCGAFELSMADPKEVPIPYGALTVKPKDGMNLRLKVVEGW